MRAKLQLREFNAAIRAYAKESKKDFSDVINHAGAKVAVRAIRETPAAKKGQRPLRASDDPTRTTKGGKYTRSARNSQRLFFGLAKKAGKRGDAAVIFARRLWASRRSGIGEGKAGWIKPALQMGARIGARVKSGSKTAGASTGKKASPRWLRARLQNMADAAGTKGAGGIAPLQRAIAYATADMLVYARRKMAARARRYSA